MTTKFRDNKIFTFEFLLSWRFPRKQAFLDDFPLCPQGPPPPQKRKFYFYCRLAVSECCFSLSLSLCPPMLPPPPPEKRKFCFLWSSRQVSEIHRRPAARF